MAGVLGAIARALRALADRARRGALALVSGVRAGASSLVVLREQRARRARVAAAQASNRGLMWR